MKQYLTQLLVLSVVMMLAAFAMMWFHVPFFEPLPAALLPLTVLYFLIVDGVQYWLTMRSVDKHPKTFVQTFLAVSVGVLFLHLVVLVAGMFSNPSCGKRYAIAFMVLYVVYTVFIMASFVRFVKQAGKSE